MISQWKGSYQTAGNVMREIQARYGEEAAKEYNPNTNCFTFKRWQEMGYRVKSGEKAIRSITMLPVEVKDRVTGEKKLVKVGKGVCLFFKTQVIKRGA